jgi:hypothetical protein
MWKWQVHVVHAKKEKKYTTLETPMVGLGGDSNIKMGLGET